ncbi:MAG: lamin tail domain-containing protein [Chitinophagales bacterium]
MKSFGLIGFLFFCFSAFSQNRYDVVIDEIMADPAPQIGLPDNEWIELKNTSTTPIDLRGWHIGDVTGQSGAFPDFTLHPDSFVIVCTGSAVAAMSAFGSAISVTAFPSLNNDGGQLFLLDANGSTIHAVNYSNTWYQNELKKNGGWTLEMIDTKNPCAGSSNWKASINPQGGTPGIKNSIDGINTDQTPPKLKYVYAMDSLNIVAVFDEPLDSLSGATISNYNIDGGLSFADATTLTPIFNRVQLKLSTPLLPNTVYTLTANNVTDCNNNTIGAANTAKLGLPVEASPSDIVINEILFNPKAGGYDYVEFYNRSNKIFDASGLFAANRSSSGGISSIEQIFPTPIYVFPGGYFVITENAASLETNYLVKNPDAVMELSSLPSYPDDGGDVVLLNGQGDIVDEVKYSAGWQFKLIDNPEGVSLERIDPSGPSQNEANWHSAASTAGYGTPTYKNSQYKQTQSINAIIDIVPKIFSPDNDGHDDVATIQYKVTEPGYVANIAIFDSRGIPVRYLVKNGTLGLNGQWNWDGLDEKGNKLAIGTYIIYTEIFNLQGENQHFKNTVVLARRLN